MNNDLQHNRQVDFPGELHSLQEFVYRITVEYIELRVPNDIAKNFDWNHPTCQQLFNQVDVLNEPHFEYIDELVPFVRYFSYTTIRLFFNPELKYKLFPFSRKMR